MAFPELPVPFSPATRRKWAQVINEALYDLNERVSSGGGTGGGGGNTVTLTRNPDGSWPGLPSPAPEHIFWADLTGLARSDPPAHRPTKDLIIDPGTA